MFLDATYRCAYCGEDVESSFDPGQGTEADYIEDCQVCCRPNRLRCRFDPRTREVWVHAEAM